MWASELGASVYSAPVIGDLRSDGQKEIIAGTFVKFLDVLDGATGHVFEGWPVNVGQSMMHSSPVLHDVDRDGVDEILIATSDGHVAAFVEDGLPYEEYTFTVPKLRVTKDWFVGLHDEHVGAHEDTSKGGRKSGAGGGLTSEHQQEERRRAHSSEEEEVPGKKKGGLLHNAAAETAAKAKAAAAAAAHKDAGVRNEANVAASLKKAAGDKGVDLFQFDALDDNREGMLEPEEMPAAAAATGKKGQEEKGGGTLPQAKYKVCRAARP
jgi:hypothetical protein